MLIQLPKSGVLVKWATFIFTREHHFSPDVKSQTTVSFARNATAPTYVNELSLIVNYYLICTHDLQIEVNMAEHPHSLLSTSN